MSTIAGTPAAQDPPAADTQCPNCMALRSPSDAFCEACRFDFNAETMPGPAEQWTLVIEADLEFFELNRREASAPITFPEDRAPRTVPLTGDEVSLGRRNDATISVRDAAVSRHHAVLRRQAESSWVLVDEGSTNGTWLNDDRVRIERRVPIHLDDGDRIYMGAFTLITVHRA